MKQFRRIFYLAILSFFTLPLWSQTTIEFVENKGQWDASVLFKGDVSNGALFLQKGGFTILQHKSEDLQRVFDELHGHSADDGHNHGAETSGRNAYPKPVVGDPLILRSHAYKVQFVGANENSAVQREKPVNSYVNYFVGDDPSKWGADCKIFQAVTYKDIYPNIDVRYYAQNNQLKYDFIVHPGGNVNDITMSYEGADRLYIKKKELVIQTSVGDIKELEPYSYQPGMNGTEQVNCRFVVQHKNTVKFKVTGYDPSKTLIIDPTLVFSTFTGSASSQWGFTATYGSDGSLYSGGIVFGSGFPTSPGAFQSNYSSSGTGNERFNIGIMKFNASGSNRVYATYIGGGFRDQPHSLIEDSQGNLVILGRTSSDNYPLQPQNNRSGPNGGWDLVVTKLNATGTALIGSMRIGGTGTDGANMGAGRNREGIKLFYGDDSRSEVILDAADNIYFVSNTQSNGNAANRFPTTLGHAPAGEQDGVLVKLNPSATNVVFSTLIGGSKNDGAYVLALHPTTNEIYVAGTTESNDMPGVPASGVMYPAFQGGPMDGFVSIFNTAGALQRTTYMGAPGQNVLDAIYGLKFSETGFPYIMGVTMGSWPVSPGVYSNPSSKQFITKLRPDLSGSVYSTVFGSGAAVYNISPVAFAVDKCENVYVAGWGGRLIPGGTDEFGTAGTGGLPLKDCNVITGGCVTDGSDFYFFVLQKDAQDILFGAYYGYYSPDRTGLADHVDGGTSRFDANGIIYQSICAACNIGRFPSHPFPTTPGVWRSQSGNPDGCNLAAVKIEMDFSGVTNSIRPTVDGIPYKTYGCAPVRVDFMDTLQRGRMYVWDYGDGNRDTTQLAISSHTYNNMGTYNVRLITIDSTKCIMSDTAYTTISVRNDRANVGLDIVKQLPCEALQYQFNNLSTHPPGKPFTDTSFVWDFGDGTPPLKMGPGAPMHSYAAPGTYIVTLTLRDTSYCNGPETITDTLSVAMNVKAQFETDPGGCVPHTAVFVNTSEAGRTFEWDFGDGQTSTDFAPTHLYAQAGTYTITLIVRDPNTCNQVDQTTRTITVRNAPTAGFTFSPVTPLENTPTTFTNTSMGAVRYHWDFGDGDTANLTNPTHQYNRTGEFEVCLIAYNEYGCPDTACSPVSALVSPLIAVPSAFTPNGDGTNDHVYVRGYAINRMLFRIYNRWGQVVFESTSQSVGWDGKYKGVLQPMDAYAYTLEVEFTDGTRASKKGDITLLR